MTDRSPAASTQRSNHRLQVYASDALLAGSVTDFMLEGLASERACVAIATAAHQAAFVSLLASRGADVDALKRSGRLVLVDAEQALATFAHGDRLDEELFLLNIGAIVERAAATGAPPYAYGEMVDVLWQRGAEDAALELEALWNRLGERVKFTLLCAYALSGFPSAADAERFAAVCGAHSEVHASQERLLTRGGSELARLEQRAFALERELEMRRAVEAELRAALEARQRAEHELRDFIENAVVPLHWVGADGTILWANASELAMLGYRREEYVGRNIRDFHVDRPAIEEIFARLTQNERLAGFEARLRAKDGAIRHVIIDSHVYWRDGQFGHTCCFTRDVTDRKRAEAARDEFLAMLGHELRNPLAPIVTAVQLLDLKLGDAGARERAVIRRQSQHMVRLVDDLLDASRIALGKIVLQKQPVELSAAVTAALETAGPLILERKHTLELDVPSEGLRVDGDEQRLAQIVSNLLVNAAKYTLAGGTIRLAASASDGWVELRVEDNGRGLAQELLPVLFEPFTQGARTLDRSEGGLGLGLAIVKSLVEQHGGSVSARSEGNDRGSTFTVRLPHLDSRVRPSQVAASSAHAHQPRRRVLVVDDNRDAAEMVAEALQLAGYIVQVAYDAEEAMARMGDFTPEVAILDVGLPNVDGYELARIVRRDHRFADLGLIALTGFGQSHDRQKAISAGFDAFLAKPVTVDVLQAEVERILGESAGVAQVAGS